MKAMQYKGYSARIEYSDEDRCFVGHMAGIRDIVGFHGESVAEMRAAFEEAVDDYLALCAETGKRPDKPYSGRIMLRVPPELHAQAARRAEANGLSLNQWAMERLSHG
jgi:predicted HicB family RNase H-like nuclease